MCSLAMRNRANMSSTRTRLFGNLYIAALNLKFTDNSQRESIATSSRRTKLNNTNCNNYVSCWNMVTNTGCKQGSYDSASPTKATRTKQLGYLYIAVLNVMFSDRSPYPGACNSHTKPMSRRFYRPGYF